MDKEGIKKRRKELFDSIHLEDTRILLNPLKNVKGGYMLYDKFFVPSSERSELLNLFIEMFD